MGEEPSKLINEEFKRVFGTFVYPFKTSDQLINKMSDSKKRKYYKEAVKLRDSEVNKQELNEICRSLYFELAVNGDEKETRAFYKGALLFANKYWLRMKSLSMRDEKEESEAMEKAQDKINELIGE